MSTLQRDGSTTWHCSECGEDLGPLDGDARSAKRRTCSARCRQRRSRRLREEARRVREREREANDRGLVVPPEGTS